MCDQPATSDEHVPPKGLFPESKDVPFENRPNFAHDLNLTLQL